MFRGALDMDQQFLQAHFDLGMAYVQAGRLDEAIAEIEPALQGSDDWRRSVMLAVMGNTLARAGRQDRARTLLSELRERCASGRATNADLSYVLTGLGDIDDAIDCLERACDTRAGLLVYLKVEPMFDPLREQSRFQKLLRRVNLA